MRVFIDARHHIPRHRSLVLFRELVQQLGIQQTLSIVSLLIVDSSIRMKQVPQVVPHQVDDHQSPVSSLSVYYSIGWSSLLQLMSDDSICLI